MLLHMRQQAKTPSCVKMGLHQGPKLEGIDRDCMKKWKYSQLRIYLQNDALGTVIVQWNKFIPQGYHTEKATEEIEFFVLELGLRVFPFL